MTVELFVNGTLMRNLKVHRNLDGAEFMGEFRTAPVYRLYSIGDIHPGMFEVEYGGIAVTGEIYRMSDEIWARVEAGEPPNLYRGPVKLANGKTVDGILFPRALAESRHKDISGFGSWRAYIATLPGNAGA
jgi:gamma-glutamylcyclotransferase (GGCT)/AIG2-like uncharacterized protein YtfP